jgi:hypothetical protein
MVLGRPSAEPRAFREGIKGLVRGATPKDWPPEAGVRDTNRGTFPGAREMRLKDPDEDELAGSRDAEFRGPWTNRNQRAVAFKEIPDAHGV